METIEPQKRLRPSNDFYESLMCLLCTDFYKPPILQCSKGHSYCKTCVSRMSSPKSCAICRSVISSSIRNYSLEELLEKFTVQCQWKSRGCEKVVNLFDRISHEKECLFRPRVECYYKKISKCEWLGDPQDLAEHLKTQHETQELTRGNLFRYLWNPPSDQVERHRFRVLKYVVSADSEPFIFILEHYYSPLNKLLCFLVRSPDPDVRRRYKISILNRKDDSNRITYEGTTLNFEEAGHITDFLNQDLTKIFLMPLKQLKSFCFYCDEDQCSYFSLHIQFL